MTIYVEKETDDLGRTYNTYTCGYCYKPYYREEEARACGNKCTDAYSKYRADAAKQLLTVSQETNKMLKFSPKQDMRFPSTEIDVDIKFNGVVYKTTTTFREDIYESLVTVQTEVHGGGASYLVKSNVKAIGVHAGKTHHYERDGIIDYSYAYPNPQNMGFCTLLKEDVDRLAKVMLEKLIKYNKSNNRHIRTDEDRQRGKELKKRREEEEKLERGDLDTGVLGALLGR